MKKIAALLLMLAMMLSLVACGKEEPAPAPADPGTAPAADGPYANLEPVVLIGGDNAGAGAVGQLCGELLTEKIAEITGGKLTIEYYPNGTLGSDTDMQQQMLDGDLDLVICQTAQTVSFVPEVAIFDLPCAFAGYSAEGIDKALNDSSFFDDIDAAYRDKGFASLGFLQGATYRLTSSNKALNTMEDFSGLVIRTMENKYHMGFWKDWGANPTPYTWSEVFIALQQGMFDAQENAADTIVGASLYDVQDYLCLTNHILYCNQLLMSEETFDSLDPAYQEALREAADFAIDHFRGEMTNINDTNIATLEENGMTVITYDDAFYAKLKEMAAPTYAMIAADVGQDLVDTLQSELEATK